MEVLRSIPINDPTENVTLPESLPESVSDLILAIAKSGRVPPELMTNDGWRLLRNAIAIKIRTVLIDSRAKRGFLGPPLQSFESRSAEIQILLSRFEDEAPFTIQRVCEILTMEETTPASTHKKHNALERVLSVTSGTS